IHLPDGPYFYIAAVTDGQSSLTWDLSHDYRNDYSGFNDNLNVEDYDPFDNRPLKFTYSNFTQPGRVTIAMSTTSAYVNGNCLAPTETFFCPVYKRWQESGPHTFTWPGLDPFGVYRAIKGVAIVTSTSDFPKNAAVLYGTRPVLANVKVTPAVFGPASGQQTVELDLSTFQSRPVRLTVELFNLATKAVLRTIEAPAQAAGHVVIPWDGRADNGLFLAAGRYRVLVRASDETGNVAEAGILTTIQY
ncbi:MAG TPA: FlgD immunoglobulin-like domain containing protein, partial [Thermoanaerobaculia bacterium]|nr:FlgD immunoglobulin-like domain containing protein [Thermoanaerobaculia bacterium]